MSTDAALRHAETAMGTVVSYLVEPGELRREQAAAAIMASCAELHRLDAMLSTWLPDSPVSRYRRGELVAAELPVELRLVLEQCTVAKELSAGWFDPWAMPGGVDPTGLAKGWIVERALRVLLAAGAGPALVNGGGDIASSALTPSGATWRIGVRHPWRTDALAAVVEVQPGTGMATSGTYERGRHLIDPMTGAAPRRRPSEEVVSSTVVGESLTLADALATAVAVAPPAAVRQVADAARSAGYEAYWILADGTEESTPGFPFVKASPPSAI